MRWVLVVTLVASSASAAEHADWTAYQKANRFTCPGPFDSLTKPRKLTLAGKAYEQTGYKLEVKQPDADGKVKVGVLSAIKDTSAGTKKNLADAFAWFKREQVEWVVVNGDLALEEFALEEVIDLLGQSGFPILVVLGNSESKGSFARAYGERADKYPNFVNGTWVRQVVADDVEFWTVPGYFDRKFVHQGAGCAYKPGDLEAMAEQLTPSGSGPLVLVSHGPPKGQGKTALDWMSDKQNVGDPDLASLITKKTIPFGLFGHILEAGGSAVGQGLAGVVKPGQKVAALYVNAGSISGDPWRMNDGSTSNGLALLVTLDAGKGSYEIKRFKPPAE